MVLHVRRAFVVYFHVRAVAACEEVIPYLLRTAFQLGLNIFWRFKPQLNLTTTFTRSPVFSAVSVSLYLCLYLNYTAKPRPPIAAAKI